MIIKIEDSDVDDDSYLGVIGVHNWLQGCLDGMTQDFCQLATLKNVPALFNLHRDAVSVVADYVSVWSSRPEWVVIA
jgi:hypothetical protein